MRSALLALALLTIIGCAVRVPTARPLVTRVYEGRERKELVAKLTGLLATEKIGIATVDVRAGAIVTDSFDVLPEYCDCGKNFLGAEYPGQRRGVLRVKVTGGRTTTVTIDFKTRLRIRANEKLVHCTSFGILEERLLTALE